MENGKEEEKKRKYIVLDIVFYGSSLNYDWGGGTNYQELKKITRWDGRQYVLVSRYALRYSILHWANKMFPDKWKLAGKDVLTGIGENEVVRPFGPGDFRKKVEEEYKKNLEEKFKNEKMKEEEIEEKIKNKLKTKEVKEKIEEESWRKYRDFLKNIFVQYPEFDLFGFMVAEGGGNEAALTRTSPVKISHAISMTPTNIDTHTMANLDMKRRAGGKGSNPVTMEEKTDFYVYNVTIDVNRIGKYLLEEHGKEDIGNITIYPKLAKERIEQFIEALLHLKRDIKARREDLSPWLMIVGLYENGRYETFMDKIRLNRKTHYRIRRKYKKGGDEKEGFLDIENEIEEGLMPLFRIDVNEIDHALPIYYRKDFCDYEPKDSQKFKPLNSKKEVLREIACFLYGEKSNECKMGKEGNPLK